MTAPETGTWRVSYDGRSTTYRPDLGRYARALYAQVAQLYSDVALHRYEGSDFGHWELVECREDWR